MKEIVMTKRCCEAVHVIHGIDACQADIRACPEIKALKKKAGLPQARLGVLTVLWPDGLDVSAAIVAALMYVTPFMTELTIGTPNTETGRRHANGIYMEVKRKGYMIDSQYADKAAFRGRRAYLSNFWPCKVRFDIDGETMEFDNAEAAFQASKYPEYASAFRHMSGPAAKKKANELRRVCPIDAGKWNEQRIDVMRGVLRSKFSAANEELCELLSGETGEIIERNA